LLKFLLLLLLLLFRIVTGMKLRLFIREAKIKIALN